MKNTFFLSLLFFAIHCKKTETPIFKAIPASKSGIDFNNKLQYNDTLTVLDFEYMFNGGGVALIDVNNDGLQDVFFTGNMVPCRLYLNKGNLKFEDITAQSGIKTDLWCYGASVVDVNQDGFKDLYICVAGNRKTLPNQMRNYFYINDGQQNRDRQPQGIAHTQPNQPINQSTNHPIIHFTDKDLEMGLIEDGYDVQSVFFDYDKDGDLDMYLSKNAFVSYNRNQIRKKQLDGLAASNDRLFRNNGANMAGIIQFEDVSKAAGITIEGFGLGVAACDLNEDGWTDIYVSNDFLTNDLIWINNQKGGFINKAKEYLKHETYNAMGNDVADYNNDGKPDIFVVDMLPPDNKRWKLTMMGNRFDEFYQTLTMNYEPQYVRNTLQLNTGNDQNGEPTFSEIGQMAGIHATEWSWAPLLADYDNDGWKDLFIANGYRQDVTNLDFIMYGKNALFMGTPEGNRKERTAELKKYTGIQVPNVMYRNKRDLTFEDVSKKWGIGDEATYSNGAAYGDLDNDGDLDLVINNLDQAASIFENTSAQNPNNQYLRIKLKGDAPNLDAYGTKVWIWQKGQLQYQYFSPVRGYLSTMEHFMHFGLEAVGRVDSLKVQWPDGREQKLLNIGANQVLVLDISASINIPKVQNLGNIAENHQKVINFSKTPNFSNVHNLQEVAKDLGIDYLHVEDDFIDFKEQALLPHLHSHAGPMLAVADINGDKLEDFIVGTSTGFSKKIFIQEKNGQFKGKDFLEKNTADDGALLFFDADGDGDQDLYTAAGCAGAQKNEDAVYTHHLYNNDGKGNFTQTSQFLSIKTASACVAANDFDHDGDLDLFVGGRLSPLEYPKTPRSYLLKNEKGIFTDVTPENLKYPGMICSAIWADYDGDGWQDLILAGEYTSILFYKNVSTTLNVRQLTNQPINQSTNQPKTGWWNALIAADFDHDGDLDLVAGNRGLNGFYKASLEEPIQVYGGDFDKNGLIDPIMTYFWDGEEYMAHTRDDVNKQIAAMRGRFKNYTEFAEKSFNKSFRKDELAAAQKLKAETFASTYFENKGNGQFEARNLPIEAQFSTINGFLAEDVNNDGNLDLLCVGNNFSNEVQFGRYDAQASFALLGDGKGGFSWNRPFFYMDGDVKSLAKINLLKGNVGYLVGRNSGKLAVFGKK
jgi:enediyne biosynthesis protein E4